MLFINRNDELKQIEQHFHKLIDARSKEGSLDPVSDYPALSLNDILLSESRWFPVPGMYGGFRFTLEDTNDELVLTSESWCRVVGGSGQRHRITRDGTVLLEEGFV